MLYLMTAGVIVAGAFAFMLLTRVVPRGVTLAIAVGIGVAVWLVIESTGRESGLRVLAWGLTLLVFTGGLVGLFDVCRRRPPKDDRA